MSIITLPSMETTFTISVKGSETGQMFDGTFTYKRPNFRTKSQIAKTLARLNENLTDEDMTFLHEVLSVLRHTLTQAPEWWTKSDSGLELYDINVSLDIYKHCQNFEREWRDKVWAEESTSESSKATV